MSPLDEKLISLEAGTSGRPDVDAVFRPVHSLKGNAAFFGLNAVKRLAHGIENVLDELRSGRIEAGAEIISVLLDGFDALRTMLSNVRDNQDETHEIAQTSSLHYRLEKALRKTTEQSKPAWARPGDKSDGLPEKPPEKEKTEAAVAKTMRVSEEAIDSFLDYVGELTVTEEMFAYSYKRLSASCNQHDLIRDLKRVIDTFSTLSANLRKSILEVRLVPLRNVLQKAPRIARNVLNTNGKKARVVVSGEELVVDKSYIDVLDAPLMHLVRNAVDHGIEPPEVRIAASKPPEGTIRIEAQRHSDDVVVCIGDDGAGIDLDAVRDKAIRAGIVKEGEPLDGAGLIRVLSTSGFSTARAVTDISGRGVGMDVVADSIHAVGGNITLETATGKGTTFTIRFPRSVRTRIMHGLVVSTQSGFFIFPSESVGECFNYEPSVLHHIPGRGKMIVRRGEALPAILLDEVLGSAKAPEVCAGRAVILNVNGVNHTIVVNDIIGIQQVVVKEMTGLDASHKLFEGAAMMGDGSLALFIGHRGLESLANQCANTGGAA
ncbi:MAG: hypothetical protein GF344_13700 [Chitinivibrionales bacterium]|nr:hypothetical protein [Chitinivibrionales bacterium]MBD3357783.1 hypothetical protein [Chitinivibrionales bacterium]